MTSNRTRWMSGVLAVGAALALSGYTCQNSPTPASQDAVGPELAKDFSAAGNDGKTYTLANTTDGGKTLVLWFVKNGCGANPRAVPLFKAVADPFLKSDKVSFFTVFNDNKDEFDAFLKEYDASFKGLLDPDMKVIKAYSVRSSQGCAVVRDGKIVKFWKGFSKASLTELGGILAEASGIKFDADLSSAPNRESYG